MVQHVTGHLYNQKTICIWDELTLHLNILDTLLLPSRSLLSSRELVKLAKSSSCIFLALSWVFFWHCRTFSFLDNATAFPCFFSALYLTSNSWDFKFNVYLAVHSVGFFHCINNQSASWSTVLVKRIPKRYSWHFSAAMVTEMASCSVLLFNTYFPYLKNSLLHTQLIVSVDWSILYLRFTEISSIFVRISVKKWQLI